MTLVVRATNIVQYNSSLWQEVNEATVYRWLPLAVVDRKNCELEGWTIVDYQLEAMLRVDSQSFRFTILPVP